MNKNRIILCIVAIFLIVFGVTKMTLAASSYTNAYEFYESTGYADNGMSVNYHADAYCGSIYYATSEILAYSSDVLKFQTVGFDVTMSGNGKSISFAVKRGGAYMSDVPNSERNVDGRNYTLYCISEEHLRTLAELADTSGDKSLSSNILAAKVIEIRMDAIITTKQNGELNGGVSENGIGGLTEWGTIYHLNNSNELKEARSVFTGSTFSSYINIKETIVNNKLNIRYNVLGKEQFGTSEVTVGNGYSISDDGILLQNGSTYMTSSYLMNEVMLLDPNVPTISKTGYHMKEGREWLYDNRTFDYSVPHRPVVICPEVGEKDKNITMYANWEANWYTLRFNANQGNGTIGDMTLHYDTSYALPTNTFYRTGYHLVEGAEWNTKADGTGVSYSQQEVIRNLTTKHNEVIVLYANWEPNKYTIVVDDQFGSGGVGTFIELYDNAFYLTEADADARQNAIDTIATPIREGYDFDGYFESVYKMGQQIVSSDGRLLIYPAYYTSDGRIFASYTAKEYVITFDKQGGDPQYGTDSVIATYGNPLPQAEAPYREGYTFCGYYTEPKGQGIKYYTDSMGAVKAAYDIPDDLTLYAYWIDESEPFVLLSASNYNWTNNTVTMTAYAKDSGTGLKKIELYLVSTNELVAETVDLTPGDGEEPTYVATLIFPNPTEGAIYYKALAYDLAGNVAESYATAQYDITAPKLTSTVKVTFDTSSIRLQLQVTDLP